MHILVINLKNNIIPLIFLLFTIFLVLFSNTNLEAAKKGLLLWATSVVPSLFPFFIATELLTSTYIPTFLGKLFEKIMKPLFNINGEGSFAIIMGILSGYPVGAKIATTFYENGTCSKEESERLLSFTNNSGPLFIMGTVGISMFGSKVIGFLLLITHILASLTVGILIKSWRKNKITYNPNVKSYKKTPIGTIHINNLGELLSRSITNSTSTIMMIGGFVVLFSVIISMLTQSKIFSIFLNIFSPIFESVNISSKFIIPIFTGLLEITNGINSISLINIKNISLSIILVAFLLGLGGFSVFLQVLSITSKTDLSIKPYILGKFLHGLLSAFYVFLFIEFFPVFNFNLL